MKSKFPLIWAHRGARSVAPENTLAAAQAAVDQYSDGWEMDVRMTADGKLVMLHDLDLSRTTNIAEVDTDTPEALHPVTDFTLEKLRELSFGSWFSKSDPFGQIEAGNVDTAMLEHFATERVATLEQVLEFSSKNALSLNIEIKNMRGYRENTIVDEVATLLSGPDWGIDIIISSFELEYLKIFRALCPQVPVGYLVEHVTSKVIDNAVGIGAKAIHPNHEHLEENHVRKALEKGLDVNIYTLNDPEEAVRFMEMGVTGIITDFPALIRSALTDSPDQLIILATNKTRPRE